MKHTPGPWGFHDKDNRHMVTAGKDKKGAFIYVCDPSYSPARQEKGNSHLIKASPSMYKEILETMDRVDKMMKDIGAGKYVSNDSLLLKLGTIHMDLNRVAAIADGSWPE